MKAPTAITLGRDLMKLDWKRSSRASLAGTTIVARKTADGRYPGWSYELVKSRPFLARHRVSLPHRGRRTLDLRSRSPLLNADQAAPGPADKGQWGDRPSPSARRWANLWLAYPDATSAACAKLTANMSHQQWPDWVSPREPSAAWPSGLVVLAVAARLLVPRLAVDEHEPAAVAHPTGMVFLQPPQVCSLRATGRVSDSVTQVMTSRSS